MAGFTFFGLAMMRARMAAISFLVGLAGLMLFTVSSALGQTSLTSWTPAPRGDAREEPIQPTQLAAEGRAPRSLLLRREEVSLAPVHRLGPLDASGARRTAKDRQPTRIGALRDAPLNLGRPENFLRLEMSDGVLYLARLVSPGAAQLQLHFTMPNRFVGSRLFAFARRDPANFTGPFPNEGTPKGAAQTDFWTTQVAGEELVIEYFIPRAALPSAPNELEAMPFRLLEVGHFYQSAQALLAQQDEAAPCNLEVPAGWRESAKAVAMLTFSGPGGLYQCTGTLLNSAPQNGTPYLLTANHCLSRAWQGNSLVAFWFRDDRNFIQTQRISSGADFVATGLLGDFTLLKLRQSPPEGVRFAGWTAERPGQETAVTGLHHPQGSYKRAALGATTLGACPPGLPTELCAGWQSVRWRNGITEPGSSGSALFVGSAADPRVAGVLTGGASACNNRNGLDFYGGLDAAWPALQFYLTGAGCSYAPEEAGQWIGANGGAGHVKLNIASAANTACPWQVTSGAAWLRLTSAASGSGATTISYEADANPGAQPRTGYLRVAGQFIAVTQAGTGSDCARNEVVAAGNIYTQRELNSADCRSTLVAGAYADRYVLNATAGQQLAVLVGATEFPNLVALFAPDGTLVAINDNGRLGENFTGGYLTLPTAGAYVIEVTSLDPAEAGRYVMTLYKGCTCELASARKDFDAAGGTGELTVTATPDCPWFVEVQPDWVTINAGSSGRGDGKVSFTVQPFAGTVNQQRTGIFRVWVRDGPYTNGNLRPEFGPLTQSLPCQFNLESRNHVVGVLGSPQNWMQLQTGSYCQWTGQTDSPWLRVELRDGRPVNNPQRGIADLNYVVTAANLSPTTRSATLRVGDATQRVTQPGFGANCRIKPLTPGQPYNGKLDAACAYPAPGEAEAIFKGDYLSFSGTMGQRVAVVLSSQTPNLGLTLLASDGRLLAQNPGNYNLFWRVPEAGFFTLPETGVYYLAVGSGERNAAFHDYSVMIQTPSGPDCALAYSLNNTQLHPAAGAQGSFTWAQTNAATCTWTALSNQPWLTVAQVTNAQGNATIAYTVAPNPGNSGRVGFITVGGWSFRVLQEQSAPFAVVSAATYTPRIGNGSLVSLFGAQLATGTAAASGRLSTEPLGGAQSRVLAGGFGESLPLLFASPSQLNFALTEYVEPPPELILEVRRVDGLLQFGRLRVERHAPGLFSANASGSGLAAAVVLRVRADRTQVFEPVAERNAEGVLVARPIDLSIPNEEVFLLLFGTGMRRLFFTADANVEIARERQEVTFAGAQGNFVGLDQLNVRLSPSLRGKGEVSVQIVHPEARSNTVTVSFK